MDFETAQIARSECVTSTLIPYPARADANLFDEYSPPALSHPMESDITGLVNWMLTDVSHGFISFADDEIAAILSEKCLQEVHFMPQDFVLSSSI